MGDERLIVRVLSGRGYENNMTAISLLDERFRKAKLGVQRQAGSGRDP